jgi:hypothetical protein
MEGDRSDSLKISVYVTVNSNDMEFVLAHEEIKSYVLRLLNCYKEYKRETGERNTFSDFRKLTEDYGLGMLECFVEYVRTSETRISFIKFRKLTTMVEGSQPGATNRVADISEGTPESDQTTNKPLEALSHGPVTFRARVSVGTHEEEVPLLHSDFEHDIVDMYSHYGPVHMFWTTKHP